MAGSLGAKIGEGAFADVHGWASGRVEKLFKPGVRRQVALHKACMTRVAFTAAVESHLPLLASAP